MKNKSEFGKGFTYCLAMFVMHFENDMALKISRIQFVFSKEESERGKILTNNPEDFHNYGWNKDMVWWNEHILPIYGSWEKALSSEIEMWANGASDHLYEIETPKQWKGTLIERKVKKLRNLGLEIGHGFTGKLYTFEDFQLLTKLTSDIFKLTDKKLEVNQKNAQFGEL